ncbi:MAG: hypothetical protein R3C39_07315 [Dehalococcoidia bacterium]
MPTFIDRHEHFPRPDATGLEALRAQILAPANEHGVKGINVLFEEDGSASCLMDAPDREAVLKSHEGTGLVLSLTDIKEYTGVI